MNWIKIINQVWLGLMKDFNFPRKIRMICKCSWEYRETALACIKFPEIRIYNTDLLFLFLNLRRDLLVELLKSIYLQHWSTVFISWFKKRFASWVTKRHVYSEIDVKSLISKIPCLLNPVKFISIEYLTSTGAWKFTITKYPSDLSDSKIYFHWPLWSKLMLLF